MDITDWRKKIDDLDDEIVKLLNERAAAAIAIGEQKASQSAAIYEPQREQQVLDNVQRLNAGPLSGAQLQDIYQRVMDIMRALQRPSQSSK
jgi:chorismate mutase